MFQSVLGSREQERAVGVVQEVYGETWADEALKHLHHAPPGMVRPMIDALAAAGKRAELGALYRDLISRPLRAPEMLIALPDTLIALSTTPSPVRSWHSWIVTSSGSTVASEQGSGAMKALTGPT